MNSINTSQFSVMTKRITTLYHFYKKNLYLFILLFIGSFTAQASHIVGGELYYTCLGNDQFEITLTIYRDCATGQAPFDDPAYLGIFEGLNDTYLRTENLQLGAISPPTPLSILDPCLEVEDDVCIHSTVYRDTINLPFRPGGYKLAYQRCCRNGAIVNITQPTETGATYTAEINEESLNSCNSAAVFYNPTGDVNGWPPIFICQGIDIEFDHSAIDPDGDSLVYKLCTPYLGANSSPTGSRPVQPSNPPYDTINYEMGYGPEDMLGNLDAPFSIDPQTGMLSGRPQFFGQYVVGICVEEYRNGVLISTTRRDFQYIVGQCNQIQSQIGNPNVLCDTLTVEFENTSQFAGDFIWDFGVPGIDTDVSTEENPTYTYPDTGTYTVMLISEPGDECTDTLFWDIYLKVTEIEIEYTAEVFKCDDGILIATNNLTTPTTGLSFEWYVDGVLTSTDEHPQFPLADTGQDIEVTLVATDQDGCSRSQTTTIRNSDVPNGIFRDTITACRGDLVDLFANAFPLPNIDYTWSPATGLNNPNTINPTFIADNSILYTLTTTSPANPGCSIQRERFVQVSDIEDLQIEAELLNQATGETSIFTDESTIVACEGEVVTLSVTNVDINVTTYFWYDENGNVIATSSELLFNPNQGSTTVVLEVFDEFGCFATKEIEIIANPVNVQIEEITNPGSGSGLSDLNGDGILDICVGNTSFLSITNLDANDMNMYTWSGDTGLFSAGFDNNLTPEVIATIPGIYNLTLTATNQDGCSADIPVTIEVHETPVIDIAVELTNTSTMTTTTITDQDIVTVCGGESAELVLTSTTILDDNYTILWTDSSGNPLGNSDQITHNADGTITYFVTVSNDVGCMAETSITIQGSPIEIVIEETDNDPTNGSGLADLNGDGILDMCPNDVSALTVTSLDPTDDNTYSWSGDIQLIDGNTSDNPNPTINASQAPGVYTLILTTSNQFPDCERVDTVQIEIHDLPVIDIAVDITDNTTMTTTTVTDQDVVTVCGGESAVLSITSTTTIDNDFTISWTDSDGNPLGDMPSLTHNTDGTIVYTATITNEVGCTVSSMITVQGSPIEIVIEETDDDPTNGSGLSDLNGDGTLDMCPGDISTLTVTSLDPTDDNTYSWSGDTQIISGNISDNPNPTIIAPQVGGIYTLVLTTSNQFPDCNRVDTVLVEVHAIPEIDITAAVIDTLTNDTLFFTSADTIRVCEDQVALLSLVGINGTIDQDATVEWCILDDDGELVEGIPGDQILSVTPFGTKVYTVKIDDVGCTASTEIVLTGSPVEISILETDGDAATGDPNLTDIDGDGDLDLCVGDVASLNVESLDPTDVNTYQWTGDVQILNDATSPTPTVQSNTAGVYNLTIEAVNQYGCNTIDQVIVEIHDLPTIDLDALFTNSNGETTATHTGEDEIVNCEEDLMTLTLTSTTTLSSDLTITWLENGNPIAGESNPTITLNPDGSVMYTVVISDQFGCSTESSITVNGSPVDITIQEITTDTDGDGNPDLDVNGDGIIDLCIGTDLTLNTINNDANQVVEYLWSADPTVSVLPPNASNPTITVTQFGTYNIYLATENQWGCTRLDTIPISVTDPGEPVDFTYFQDCAGLSVNFTTNTINYEYYVWNFGDNNATIVGQVNPSYTYPAPGMYTVSLTPLPGLPCDLPTYTEVVEVESSVINLDFTYEYEDCGVDGVTIRFTDQSTSGNGTINCDWNFTYDGTNQNAGGPSPILELSSSTSLSVTKTVTDETGCSGSSTEVLDIILITPISHDDPIIHCPDGLPFGLNPNPVAGHVYTWDNGLGTTPNPTVDPEVSTTYCVTITDSNGADVCSHSQCIDVFVPADINLALEATGTVTGDFDIDSAADTTTITSCENEVITISNTTTLTSTDIASIEWTPDPNTGNTSLEVNPDGSQTYCVTVTDIYGCSATKCITVEGGPVDITIEETSETDVNGTVTGILNSDGTIDMCLGSPFTFEVENNNPNHVLSYSWTGDPIIQAGTENSANPVLDPAEEGVYTIYLETMNQFGCIQLDTFPVTVVDPNRAIDFDFVKQCDGITIDFTNNGNPDFDYIWTITNSNGGIVAIFDDYNVTMALPLIDTYTVSLEVDVNVGCLETATDQVIIQLPILTADFEYDYLDCGPDGATVQFVNTSINPENNTQFVIFHVGDTEYEGETLEFTFTQDTVIDVYVTILTTTGCEASSEPIALDVDLIEEIPLASPNIHCQNDGPIALNPDGDVSYDYQWDNGLGTAMNPMVDPEMTTTYCVTITNNSGSLPCSLVQCTTVEVADEILLTVTDDFTTNCVDTADLFVAGNLPNLTYEWFEGSNSIGTGGNITVYPSGEITYTVVATDGDSGCTESANVTVTGTGLNVSLDDLVYICQDDTGTIGVQNDDPNDELTIQWEANDHFTLSTDLTSAEVTVNTSEPFTDTFYVSITNQYNCTTTDSIIVIVLGSVQQPEWGQCEGLDITFITEDDPNAATYSWDFGDGETAEGVINPVHTYAEEGTYTVTMSLPNGDKCDGALSFEVEVVADPLAALSFESDHEDCSDVGVVNFLNVSHTGNLGTITDYAWDFEDYGTSSMENPTVTVMESDTINATLVITTAAGCQDSIDTEVPVLLINQEVILANINDCIDYEVDLNPNNADYPNYTFAWQALDGENPTVNVVEGQTTYTVTITDDTYGCTSEQEVTVENHPLINLQTPEDSTACKEEDILVAANSTEFVNFVWTNNVEDTISTSAMATVTTGDGSIPQEYMVTATDNFGCEESGTFIMDNQELILEMATEGFVCNENEVIQPTIVPGPLSSDDFIIYDWDNDDYPESISDPTAALPIFSPPASTNYFLDAVNQYGCEYSNEFYVYVSDLSADIFGEVVGPSGDIYVDRTYELSVLLADNYDYLWEGHGVDPNNNSGNMISFTPTEAGDHTYTVTITELGGLGEPETDCEIQIAITITVLNRLCDDPYVFFPNAFTPNGDGENDFLQLHFFPSHVVELEWAIYSRWGERIFETTDLDGKWDGTHLGEPVSPDVYGYWVRAICDDGQEFYRQGNVTVIR